MTSLVRVLISLKFNYCYIQTDLEGRCLNEHNNLKFNYCYIQTGIVMAIMMGITSLKFNYCYIQTCSKYLEMRGIEHLKFNYCYIQTIDLAYAITIHKSLKIQLLLYTNLSKINIFKI